MNAIDTGVLIWGVRQIASPGQEDLIPRCVRLIKELSEGGAIMVPSIVLAEYLTTFSLDDQKRQSRIINEAF
ncbi:MAG: hypothetical protein ACLQNE_35840 [Thermoguttaceae bacterium]